jgi:IS1 family transposase
MVSCHGKNVKVDSPAGWGDAWTWLALDPDSKMILSYHIGPRNTVSAYQFVHDVSKRTLGTYQITRYAGGTVIAVKTRNPAWRRILTSHTERANLSVHMHIRRFARKTNAISKKLSMLKAAVTLFVVWYNFCRVHQTPSHHSLYGS